MDDDVSISEAGAGVCRREVVVAGGCSLPVVDDDWRGAFVLVERGEVDLCGVHGTRRRFRAGAMLVLAGLGLAVVHNPGVDEAVLVALSRRPG